MDGHAKFAEATDAHSLSGYIRYTKDNVFISETRNLGIMVYDKHEGQWFNAGNMGQSDSARPEERFVLTKTAAETRLKAAGLVSAAVGVEEVEGAGQDVRP